ncbi:MAG: hypothetical protein NC390_07280 [Fusobacterium sp.]|nr:hypothetical protein [Fusobacterium sp.]
MSEILGEKKICNKCGKCCRLISSTKSYDELCADAKKGDNVAVNFLKLFLPYDSLAEAIKIDSNVVDAVVEMNKRAYGEDTQTYFYHCRYINFENECMVYNMRPKLCRQYPKNEFIPVPEECSYNGYSFAMREKIKAKVRKAKEELLDIEMLRANATERSVIERFNKLEKKALQLIENYKAFGSQDW